MPKKRYPAVVGCFLSFLLLTAITCFLWLFVSFFPPTWHPHPISLYELIAAFVAGITFTFWGLMKLGQNYILKEPQQKAAEKAKA